MLDRLSDFPTQALVCESRRLELGIIDGGASDEEIDLFVAIESELGRRIALRGALPGILDAVVDPRD